MNHITRLREQDLGPLVGHMVRAASKAIGAEFAKTGRAQADLDVALLITSAILATAARSMGELPLAAWAEANRLAVDPTSLINQYLSKNPHG